MTGSTEPAREELAMRSDTQTITIDVSPADVVTFVGDAENLPRWAIGFAKSIRRSGEEWIVTTGEGEVSVAVSVEHAAGTVDFHLEPAPGLTATAFTRAVPNGDGTEFAFTQFQQPGMPDAVFEQLVAAVGHELVTLKALLEVGCPL
jgi:hypothetical protein